MNHFSHYSEGKVFSKYKIFSQHSEDLGYFSIIYTRFPVIERTTMTPIYLYGMPSLTLCLLLQLLRAKHIQNRLSPRPRTEIYGDYGNDI